MRRGEVPAVKLMRILVDEERGRMEEGQEGLSTVMKEAQEQACCRSSEGVEGLEEKGRRAEVYELWWW